MPRPRFLKLPADKRLAIIEAAGKEFAEHGYEGASLNRIIAAAGISKGAMYYYFDGKADVFATVFRFAESQLLSLRSVDLTTLDRDTFWPALDRMAQHKEHILQDNPWLMGMARALHQMPPELWSEGEMGAYISEMTGFLRALLARGQAVGAMRQDLPLDLLVGLWLSVDQVFDKWVLDQWDDHTPTTEEWDRWFALGMDLLHRLAMPAEVLCRTLDEKERT